MDRGVWLESVGAQRVRHDQTTEHTHTHTHTEDRQDVSGNVFMPSTDNHLDE